MFALEHRNTRRKLQINYKENIFNWTDYNLPTSVCNYD